MSEQTRKKQDIIKQKNKLKVTSKFPMLVYARWISLATAMLVLIVFFLSTGFTTENMNEVITKNPIVVVGFLVCIIDMLIWAQLSHLISYLKDFIHIEAVRIQLLAIGIVQLMCFNYVSLLCIIYAMVRYFNWNGWKVTDSIKEIKKDGQWGNTLALTVILVLAGLLTLFMLAIFQGV